MVTVFGTYIKSIWRNEKTGYTQFTVGNKGTVLVCEGVIPNLPYKTPLFLMCEREREEGEDFVYKASKIELSAYSEDVMVEFVKTRFFFGIGPATAQDAMKLFGTDLFAYVNNHFHEEIKKTTDMAIIKLMNLLREMVAQQRIISFFGKVGGSYFGALKVYGKYGADVITEVMRNPYMLLDYGASIDKCEEMAKAQGILASDKNRVLHMVEYLIKRNRNNGNTRIDIYELENQFTKLENVDGEHPENNYHTNRLFIAEALTSDRYIVSEEGNKIFVYQKDDYIIEQKIVDNIVRISRSATDTVLPKGLVKYISEQLNIQYSDEQKKAFDSLCSSGIKIITGGPGTGKTTLLNGLLMAYEKLKPGARIVLCAPTGCAAVRMHDSTGRDANTIHKTLRIKAYTNLFSYSEKLDADCIVIDEASMIDIYLFNAILSATKNGSTVFILGDKDQLPSIGVGDVLKDLLVSHAIESYELSHIFRQSEKNLIIDNSHKVINGDMDIKTDTSFQIRRFDEESDLLRELEKIAEQCKRRGITNYKIYTPSRNVKFETGSIKLNRLMQKVNFAGKSIRYGYYKFGIKDKVVFNSNNYDKGYYNGQEGIISDIQKIGDSIHITVNTGGESVHLTNMEIDDIDLGYVITAHKSQGSECDNAIIVIPQAPKNMLKRKLLYVEITRAKKNVIILSQGNALEKCISTYAENFRNTGLLYKLSKAVM